IPSVPVDMLGTDMLFQATIQNNMNYNSMNHSNVPLLFSCKTICSFVTAQHTKTEIHKQNCHHAVVLL
uniref:Uncharacterized protein n=1 Tax=Aegilops tauschii subsp. strangulata TaxID=200361 RepID=A0A453DGD5_AEGTS